MQLVANFSPGPAALPRVVRERLRAELDDWSGTGTSVMEVSHRGPDFDRLAKRSEERLRRLTGLPASTRVLFLQGGASMQSALVPLNFRESRGAAVYTVDGHWGRKAHREATRLRAAVAIDRASLGLVADPGDVPYVHVTSNETVDGLQWRHPPTVDAPVVCDMSSDICSEPTRFAAYDVIYAGAQKNLGIAGLTLVLLSDRGYERCRKDLPTLLSYRAMADSRSMANTPPTFAWYVFDQVLGWLEEQGGLTVIGARNREKAARLYGAIDASDFYRCEVPEALRSRMNVAFRTPSEEQDRAFVAAATAAGLVGLKGHRVVGGLRASLYNAIELEEVEALIAFMLEFERVA